MCTKCDWHCVEHGEHDLEVTGVHFIEVCVLRFLNLLNYVSKSSAWLSIFIHNACTIGVNCFYDSFECITLNP